MALSFKRKLTIIVLALYWPTLFIIAHIPIPRVVQEADVSDKGLHFLSYLFLTFLLWFAFQANQKVNWRKSTVWWILLLVVWYGVVDELLQRFVAGRNCDARDFVADVGGTVAGLVLLSFFSFWPAALVLAGALIFGIKNVARANVADLLPVTSALFYLLAYAIFTLLWLRSLECYLPRLRSRRVTIRWVIFALAIPVALLLTVKLTSVILERTFIMRDILISAAGIGIVVAGACVIAGHRSGRADRPDIP